MIILLYIILLEAVFDEWHIYEIYKNVFFASEQENIFNFVNTADLMFNLLYLLYIQALNTQV